jgi:hypothetical protein
MDRCKESVRNPNSWIEKENDPTMKRIVILVLAASCCALAQESGNVTFQAAGPATAIAIGAIGGPGGIVKGAPYSATVTNESVQTLSDGTRIVQSTSGSAARDSQGRTRRDAPLPSIGNLSAAEGPHFVFVQDPVAGASYTLNLTDKTAWKNPMPSFTGAPGMTVSANTIVLRPATGAPSTDSQASTTVFEQKRIAEGEVIVSSSAATPSVDSPASPAMFLHKRLAEAEGEGTTEDLGSQVMEGVQVSGVRTTHTIPAGQIGNDRPISIVTEVWTSPELKTIVLSKRNDPRVGEQTFKLTNIQRAEPDPSLFSVPSDFKITDSGARTVMYRTKQ